MALTIIMNVMTLITMMIMMTVMKMKMEMMMMMKVGDNDGYLVMKVIQSGKLSSGESHNNQRSDDL
jgi:hypothetical protein